MKDIETIKSIVGGLAGWPEAQRHIDEVAAIRDLIADLEQQIVDAREQIKLRGQEAQGTIEGLMREAAQAGCAVDAASHLYWNCPQIDATYIKRVARAAGLAAVNGAPADPSKYWIHPLEVDTFCPSCGAPQMQVVFSRTERDSVQKNGGVWCAECAQKRDSWKDAYEQRMAAQAALAERLRRLPYREYLKTDHWQQVRRDALRRAGYRCELCFASGQLDVHHKTYERRGMEQRGDLIVLCRDCHGKFHDKFEGASNG